VFRENGGYKIIIENKCCSIYLKNMFYARCTLVNGLSILYLNCKHVHNINTKGSNLLIQISLLSSIIAWFI
jgi:hypothetical protein